jgi:hypothetical protein
VLGSENSPINTNLPFDLFGSLLAFMSNGQKSFYKNKKERALPVPFYLLSRSFDETIVDCHPLPNFWKHNAEEMMERNVSEYIKPCSEQQR